MLNKKNGFTMIEMLIVIVVGAILLAVAAPSFQTLVQQYRAYALASNFASSLAYARSEAVRQGVPVTVCPAGNSSLNSCANTTTWTQGWLVFTDSDGDGNLATAADILRVNSALPAGITLVTGQSRVRYVATGALNITSGVLTFSFRPNGCTGNNARLVTINYTGRASLTMGGC